MNLQLLEHLCQTNGIIGDERSVQAIILEEIKDYADSIETDSLDNLLVLKKGKERAKTKLLLYSYMNAVEMIVTGITEEGLLKFSTIGGIESKVLCGCSVLVTDIPGVIGVPPIHLLNADERKIMPSLDNLFIDIGADSREKAEQYITLGMPIYFHSIFDLSNGKIKAKSLNNRVGCALLISLIQKELKYDTYIRFSTQNKVGFRGDQKVDTYSIKPEAAIVVDSTTAVDLANVVLEKQDCRLGKGPVISFIDHPTLYDSTYYKVAFEEAAKQSIPCQVKEVIADGNNAEVIHSNTFGVRLLNLSLPCRYLHSAISMISQEDLENTEKLLYLVAEKIAGQEIQ